MVSTTTKGLPEMPPNTDAIEVFQELRLRAPHGQPCLPAVLAGHAQPPWRRAEDTEDSMADLGVQEARRYVVFEREEADGVHAARLFL